jgi:hypothetical protein
MPKRTIDRILVPLPVPAEESRQLAEAIADLHYTMDTIVGAARELIPGESVDELETAWDKSEGSMRQLVIDLGFLDSESPIPQPPLSHQTLVLSQLTGDIGKLKRSTLGRLKDRFFMFWNSAPRTDEKTAKSADAAGDYLEFGATVVSSIPGYEKVVELLSLGKQLVGCRAKRGV